MDIDKLYAPTELTPFWVKIFNFKPNILEDWGFLSR